jgi:hypothetical protein
VTTARSVNQTGCRSDYVTVLPFRVRGARECADWAQSLICHGANAESSGDRCNHRHHDQRGQRRDSPAENRAQQNNNCEESQQCQHRGSMNSRRDLRQSSRWRIGHHPHQTRQAAFISTVGRSDGVPCRSYDARNRLTQQAHATTLVHRSSAPI